MGKKEDIFQWGDELMEEYKEFAYKKNGKEKKDN